MYVGHDRRKTITANLYETDSVARFCDASNSLPPKPSLRSVLRNLGFDLKISRPGAGVREGISETLRPHVSVRGFFWKPGCGELSPSKEHHVIQPIKR